MSLRPALPAHVVTDLVGIVDVLVGLPEVTVLGAASRDREIDLHVMLDASRAACSTCGVLARFKGWREVVLRDLRFGDQTVALHWHKRRWRCEDADCPNGG